MTISVLADRSDVFNKEAVKPLLESVFTELYANSVFSRIIDEMLPQGFDVSKFGRISQGRQRENQWSKLVNSADGLYRVSRIMPTLDEINVTLMLFRKTEYRNHLGVVFDDEFSLTVVFTDTRLQKQRMVKSDFHALHFHGEKLLYDPATSFESFVKVHLVNNFNRPNIAQDILDTFTRHKDRVRSLHSATTRY